MPRQDLRFHCCREEVQRIGEWPKGSWPRPAPGLIPPPGYGGPNAITIERAFQGGQINRKTSMSGVQGRLGQHPLTMYVYVGIRNDGHANVGQPADGKVRH